jgi:hypothetical protein
MAIAPALDKPVVNSNQAVLWPGRLGALAPTSARSPDRAAREAGPESTLGPPWSACFSRRRFNLNIKRSVLTITYLCTMRAVPFDTTRIAAR